MLSTVRVVVIVFWLCALGAVAAVSAAEPSSVRFDIPAQSLESALLTFSQQARVQLVVADETIKGLRTRGVRGEYSAHEALTRLLQGSGLSYRVTDERTIAISTARSSHRTSDASGWTHLAQAEVLSDAPASSLEARDSRADSDISSVEQIVVTAQKRLERLQDVPVPVATLSGDVLVNSNQLRLEDYYSSIPGLSVTPAELGAPQVAVRGLTTGGNTNPTVGIVVDDVPYGSSTVLGGGFLAPDFDPSDLARIEVLRGPQGTLYGASSLGGLIKYVSLEPSMEGVTGHLQAGLSTVRNGDDAGYNARGAINLPLGDTWAMRASGFARRDPGYIDNALLGINGVNRVDAYGGRLAVLWRPSPNLSLKLSALLQNSEADGSSYMSRLPGLGDLQQSTVSGTGVYESEIQAYSATLAAHIGAADLTVLSGYNVNTVYNVYDYSPLIGPLAQAVFQVGGTPLVNDPRTQKFTQEVRLSRPLGAAVDWLVGAFYTNEFSDGSQDIFATDPMNGTRAGLLVHTRAPTTYAEYAAFTDLTWHFTERFDVQVGGRASRNRQTYSTIWEGPYVPIVLGVPSPLIPPREVTQDEAFTYLATPRVKITPELMVYARFASGYRPGGPNTNSTLNRLPTFDPDTTENYEIGIKGEAFGRALSFDMSLYYIDWKDIQLQLIDPVAQAAVYVNASRAKSQGVELSLQSQPLRGLTLVTWLAWNDAQLTEDFPPGSTALGSSGDRLPGGSRFSGNVSLDQEVPFNGRVTGFVGASLSYVGSRKGPFINIAAPSPQRQTLSPYAKTDLRAGLRFSAWTTNLFVNNVTDRRGVLLGGLGTAIASNYYCIQPRTAGISLSRTF
jgi:outer membrane receptor protein involved in Fe transport